MLDVSKFGGEAKYIFLTSDLVNIEHSLKNNVPPHYSLKNHIHIVFVRSNTGAPRGICETT